MSRIGKKPVAYPEAVTVTVENPRVVTVKGPKGLLEYDHAREVKVIVNTETREVSVEKVQTTPHAKEMWGTTIRLIANMIRGVSEGFEKSLELNGVGFRMAVQGKKLTMALGFSHSVEREIPEGLEVKIEGNTLTVSGIDKQRVGQFAAEIRALKPVEPYKGKGFKYTDETPRRKEGKKAGSAAA